MSMSSERQVPLILQEPLSIVVVSYSSLEADDSILVPNERPVSAAELSSIVRLPERIVVNLGCRTGTEALAAAFLGGGCDAYIAPLGYVEGNAAMMFAIHLFYFLAEKRPLTEAVQESCKHDAECALFKLYKVAGRAKR